MKPLHNQRLPRFCSVFCDPVTEARHTKNCSGVICCSKHVQRLSLATVRIALVVLLNVARHHHLAAEVAAANDSTESLVDLMQMFRDKKPLFILASELLVRVVNASAAAKVMLPT